MTAPGDRRVKTSHRNSPSSSEVTLKKINVSLLGTQVTFKRLSKPGDTDRTCWLVTKFATDVPPKRIDTIMILKSADTLKLQLSSPFKDPLIRLLLAAEVINASVTVSDGGGSNQVMLPPSEI